MIGIYIAGRFIPIYGLMITTGIVVSGVVAYILVKKHGLILEDMLILGAYALSGGFIGAKLLYIWVDRKQINWSRMLDLEYMNELWQGGYVFYGGLIGGLLMLFLGGWIHKIKVLDYLKLCIVCIPVAHGFGRIGCHFAGCCYGIPYTGLFHIVYHAPSFAPTELSLFPVQLLEAGLNFVIAGILSVWIWKKGADVNNIYLYLLMYAVQRFILESYLRYDVAERGQIWMFSTSQCISIAIVVIVAFMKLTHLRRSK